MTSALDRFYAEAAAVVGTDPEEIRRCVQPRSLDDIASCYRPFTVRALADEMGVLEEDVDAETLGAYYQERRAAEQDEEAQYRAFAAVLGIEPEEPSRESPRPRRWEEARWEAIEARREADEAQARVDDYLFETVVAPRFGIKPDAPPKAPASPEDALYNEWRARFG